MLLTTKDYYLKGGKALYKIVELGMLPQQHPFYRE
jgi:hypothetical protein